MNRVFPIVLVLAGLASGACGSGHDERTSAAASEPRRENRHSYLFVQDAGSGRLDRGTRAPYLLTLHDVDPTALAFDDRPGRRIGVLSIPRLLAGFYTRRLTDPPNAALTTRIGGRERKFGLELVRGTYDTRRKTLRYDAKPLVGEGERARVPSTPVALGETSVFIDSVGHTCTVNVVNYARGLHLVSASKWPTDKWKTQPPDSLPSSPPAYSWESEGGFLRGCSNTVVYRDSYGLTTRLSVTSPWVGDVTWSCVPQLPTTRCTSTTSGVWDLTVNFSLSDSG